MKDNKNNRIYKYLELNMKYFRIDMDGNNNAFFR